MVWRITLAAVCAGALAAGAQPAPYKAEAGPWPVLAAAGLELLDAARGKRLPARVTYPDGTGPFPVVLFSHGYRGSKDHYQPLAAHWAGHGYVVVQVDHSDSQALPPPRADFEDWLGRVQDVHFLIDALDDWTRAVPGLRARMDPARLGVGGHSYGAQTAQLLGGAVIRNGTSLAHPAVRAALLISGQGRGQLLGDRSWDAFTNPMMALTGTRDDSDRTGNPWTWRTEPYAFAPPGDKYLVVIEGAYHGFGGIGGGRMAGPSSGPPNADHVAYVRSASTAFWDAYLGDDGAALRELVSAGLSAASGGAVSVRHK